MKHALLLGWVLGMPARAQGLPPANSAVELQILGPKAADGAPALSQTFRLPAYAPPRLTVRLPRGATIEGTVTTPDGRPLADAEVRTEPRVPAGAEPLTLLLGQLVADLTTAARTRTGADGAFRLEHVGRGDYRVIAQHMAFAGAEQTLTVDGDAARKVPALALFEGTVVTGRVTRAAVPVAGAEVVLVSDEGPSVKGKPAPATVRFTATSDAEGRYRMPARVQLGGRFVLSASENLPPLDRTLQTEASRRVVVTREPNAQSEDLSLPLR